MIEDIIQSIDARIAVLTQARKLLTEDYPPEPNYPTVKLKLLPLTTKPKRVMSAQGRANIAAAQRKRRKLAGRLAKKQTKPYANQTSAYGTS